MKTIPAFIINGFLESGKTRFMINTVAQDYFQIKGKTLVIACEEGENEYDEAEMKSYGCVVEYLENEEDFNAENLTALQKKHKAKRVMIEWNGVWDYKNKDLPAHWDLVQELSMVDATTFEVYYANMKSLMMEMFRKSALVLFNRCDGMDDKLSDFKRNVRLANQEGDVLFEASDGLISVSNIDDLPYSLDDEIIELDDFAYATLYMDSLEFPERYEGKSISFVAQVFKDSRIPNGHFILGRDIMSCCADDLEYFGFPSKCERAAAYVDKDWVKVVAKFSIRESFAYDEVGAVLDILDIKLCEAPKEPVIGA